MSTFEAFRVFDEGGQVQGRIVQAVLDDLSAGDVVIRAAYSSVNYKDAMAATGAGKILRRFPLIPGIDVSGTVESSVDARFRPGDQVLVTGYDLGVDSDGGYSRYARVPADWVVPLPAGLDAFDVMAIGTAGFTASLSVVQLERNGLKPGDSPVIVTGATGGVGSLAVQCLAARGYEVTALTGKYSEHEYLRSIGASDVLSRSAVQVSTRPLEKATWAGAIDPVGGETLAWLLRTMRYGRCRVGADWRHRGSHHGRTLHPPGGQVAGHRLGDVPDGPAARGVAPPGDRHETGEPASVVARDRPDRSP
jgi:acrylyl-CoA reductase (NADPH)